MDKKTSEPDKKGMTMGKAILKLSAYVNSGMLTVHILKARQLFSKYTHDCQPFVQVCLEPDPSGGTKCCTSVAASSPHPTFNEKFSFEMLLPGDSKRRLHITVWNGNGPGTTAEFLGAMSFGLNSVLAKQKDISGWFYLLKEDIGKRKHLPALSRSHIYGDVGTPMQSPDDSQRPDDMPLNGQVPAAGKEIVADITIHSDFNGNAAPVSAPPVCFNNVDPQIQSLTGKDVTENTNDKKQLLEHCNGNISTVSKLSQTNTVVTSMKPLLSPKQVRFDISEQKQFKSSVLPQTGLLYPDKSVLKSSITKTVSQNPYVLHYRKEIASAERKFCDINQVEQNGIVKNLGEIVPTSVMDYPSEFKTQCCQALASYNVTSTSTSNITVNTVDTISSVQSGNTNSKEIWIDCLSLESNNTTHDSGICESSSPKSDDYCHKKLNNSDDSKGCNSTVYKESHLEPPSKSRVNLALKFPKEKSDEIIPKKKDVLISHEAYLHLGRARDDLHMGRSKSAHDFKQGRSKLSSQSFNADKVPHHDENSYPQCESCTTKYYRQLYTPVLGDRRKFKKHNNEDLHTKIYFL